jgi:opacity protein-like surface antigen
MRPLRIASLSLTVAILFPANAAAAAEDRTPILDMLYVGTDVGVSILPDVKTRPIAASPGTIGLSGLEIDMDAGVDWSIEVGLRLSEQWSVGVQSGYVYNRIRGIGAGTFTSIAPDPVTGGEGHFGQVPILVNGLFEIPLAAADSSLGALRLQLGAGLGAVHVDGSVTADGGGAVVGLEMNADGGDWTFAYQGTAALLWAIDPNVDVGIRYRFMGTTAADLGPISESSGVLAPGNLETNAVFTHAIQASLVIRF